MVNIFGMFSVALLWIAWCVLHSLLVSPRVVAFFKAAFKEKFAFYRMGYVLFSLLSLAPLLLYQNSLVQRTFFVWHGPWMFARLFLLSYSIILFAGGLFSYNLKYFTGISQMQAFLVKKPGPVPPFVVKGILRYVRHPWYSGGLVFIWAFGPVTKITLVSKFVLSLYLLIGTFLEERKLLAEIGEPYFCYQQKVPMFIPWPWTGSF